MKKQIGKIKIYLIDYLLKHITRIEVIDTTLPYTQSSRICVRYKKEDEEITFSCQDNFQTLKIFIK